MSLDVSEESDERRLPLEAWNDTARPYPRDVAAHTLFERAAQAHADAVAVCRSPAAVTYAELEARANRLAHHLRGVGAERGDIVAIQISASVDMVVAMLAVLKAGAAYLPLDRSLPDDRQRFMLDDAAVEIVVTSSAERADRDPEARFADRRVVDLGRSAAEIGSEPPEPSSDHRHRGRPRPTSSTRPDRRASRRGCSSPTVPSSGSSAGSRTWTWTTRCGCSSSRPSRSMRR